MKLLIKRIDVSADKENNVFNIQSTLNTLLGIVVAGVRNTDYQRYFPEILFTFITG